MRIFVAGASGAIGRLLVHKLIAAGRQVIGMTRSERGQRWLDEAGAQAVVVDALNADAVRAAVEQAHPDAVIDQLTSLPKRYTVEAMQAAAESDRRLKLSGGANVQRAGQLAGARRYIVQSCGFWSAAGIGLADERTPLAVDAPGAIAAGARVYTEIERRALEAREIGVTVLRYGFFYGPGTWYAKDGDMADQTRQHRLPIAGDGHGVSSFVHIEDAAAATAAALEAPPGIYNIVDGQPSELRVWLPAFARWAGAPPPPIVTEEEALRTSGPDFVYYATKLRGASNGKARSELGFEPRRLEWLEAVEVAGSRGGYLGGTALAG